MPVPIAYPSLGVINASMNQMPVLGFLQRLSVPPFLAPGIWECTADLKDMLPHTPQGCSMETLPL